jgi:hypothetical protein
MKIKTIILASLLLSVNASTFVTHAAGPKPGSISSSTVAGLSSLTPAFGNSDLLAAVSVYVDSDKHTVVINAIVANYGPGAIVYGQRTVTLTAKHKGSTYTLFKDSKIPALKGTAATPGQQAGSSFTLKHSVPEAWGFDESTIYEVRISGSRADPNPGNDVATQVGPNQPKP